jgi:hypothetical protein
VAAGFVAVAFYACRLGVPRRALLSAATLGAIAVVLTRGLTPLSAALWMVPAILPLLPAPSTLLPALAQTEPARQALQGLAAETAFLIGVGVASGSILVETSQRYRARACSPSWAWCPTGCLRTSCVPSEPGAGASGVEPTLPPTATTPSMDALRVDPAPNETAGGRQHSASMVPAVAGRTGQVMPGA